MTSLRAIALLAGLVLLLSLLVPRSFTRSPALPPPTEPAPTESTVTPRVETLAVFLLDYRNDGEKRRPAEYEDTIFRSAKSLRAFLEEISYGRVSITGDVLGWFNMSGKSAPATWDRLMQDLVVQAAQDQVEIRFDRYERFLFIARDDNPNRQRAGVSTFGPIPVQTPHGLVYASVSVSWDDAVHVFESPWPNVRPNSTVAHELIHAMGFRGHANAFDGGSVVLGDEDVCEQVAKGDPFDIMGSSNHSYHPNARIKELLGWLDPSQVVDANEAGEYVIYPLEQLDRSVKAIRIELPQPVRVPTVDDRDIRIGQLYVEYREPVGFDRWLEQLGRSGQRGVLLHGVLRDEDEVATTYLLDARPNSDPPPPPGAPQLEFSDAFLGPGDVFDRVSGLRISVVRFTVDGGVRIRIEFVDRTASRETPIPSPQRGEG